MSSQPGVYCCHFMTNMMQSLWAAAQYSHQQTLIITINQGPHHHHQHQPGRKNLQVASTYLSDVMQSENLFDYFQNLIFLNFPPNFPNTEPLQPQSIRCFKMMMMMVVVRVVVACCSWLYGEIGGRDREIERDRWRWWMTEGDTSVIRLTLVLPPAQSGSIWHQHCRSSHLLGCSEWWLIFSRLA